MIWKKKIETKKKPKKTYLVELHLKQVREPLIINCKEDKKAMDKKFSELTKNMKNTSKYILLHHDLFVKRELVELIYKREMEEYI